MNGVDWQKVIDEYDGQIVELETRVTDADRNTLAVRMLRSEIAGLSADDKK